MNEPLISIIIPVYNMEQYLERCLDSVLNSSYCNVEIICIDDGSTDKSLEILRRYEANDSRIVVFTQKNGGVSSARNTGLRTMTGEYVTFVDPDDYVHPEYLKQLYAAIQHTETGISISPFQRVGDEGEDFMPVDSESFQVCSFLQMFQSPDEIFYCCCGKLIRSELLVGLLFHEDLVFGEDTVLFSQVCEREPSNQATLLTSPLYFYYQREGSAIKSAGIKNRFDRNKIMAKQLLRSKRDDIYLHNAINWNFWVRYMVMHINPDRCMARECQRLLLNLRRILWKTDIYDFKKKIIYYCFIVCPAIDWLHRIIREPSILKWERIERNKRRKKLGS